MPVNAEITFSACAFTCSSALSSIYVDNEPVFLFIDHYLSEIHSMDKFLGEDCPSLVVFLPIIMKNLISPL